MPLLILLLLLVSPAKAQYAPNAKVPDLSFHGLAARILLYPDDRLRVAPGSPADSMIIHVPVFIRNCWRTTDNSSRDSVTGFPITSFSIPIQFDSSFVDVVAIDTSGHASNFSYTWDLSPDTTYMNIVGDPFGVRQRGMRVTIRGQAVSENDSLRLTGSPETQMCDLFAYLRMFSLVLRIKTGVNADTSKLRTALVIENDSLRYNGYRVFDTVWRSPPHRYTGLSGVNNHYFDINFIEQCRDSLRPSRYGMLWLEFTEAMPSITFTNLDGSATVDTVTIRIPRTHTWADTVNGDGIADVWVSNRIVGSRATSIAVSTQEPWMRFRSISTGESGTFEPIPAPVRTGVIPFLDRGILGTDDARTLTWAPTREQPPFRLRIFGNNTMSAKNGRFVGAISFTSTTMRPERVDLPVVLIISDTTTSVDDQGASSSWNVGSITIAPNPSSGSVTIATYTATTNATLELVASDGRIVERFAIESGQAVILPGTLSTGVYSAVLRTAGGVTSTPFVIAP